MSRSGKRRGDPYYRSSVKETLPPAQERVQRLFGLDTPSGYSGLTRLDDYPSTYSPTYEDGPGRPEAYQHPSYGPKVWPNPNRAPSPYRAPFRLFFNQLSVPQPQQVKFCVQRKKRREVLFALRRAGYGGSAKKRKWHRTANSRWSC